MHTVRAVRLRTDLSSVEKLRTVVLALVLQRAGVPERFRVLDRTEAALPEEVAALHLMARREVLAEMRTIFEEGVSGESSVPGTNGWRRCRSSACATGSRGGLRPGPSHPAEPLAGQLAQNAVDMLTYPQGIGPPATAPHRALQMVRENLNYLERFLGPPSGRDPGSTRPS